mgnify:CR=1 FL=1
MADRGLSQLHCERGLGKCSGRLRCYYLVSTKGPRARRPAWMRPPNYCIIVSLRCRVITEPCGKSTAHLRQVANASRAGRLVPYSETSRALGKTVACKQLTKVTSVITPNCPWPPPLLTRTAPTTRLAPPLPLAPLARARARGAACPCRVTLYPVTPCLRATREETHYLTLGCRIHLAPAAIQIRSVGLRWSLIRLPFLAY